MPPSVREDVWDQSASDSALPTELLRSSLESSTRPTATRFGLQTQTTLDVAATSFLKDRHEKSLARSVWGSSGDIGQSTASRASFALYTKCQPAKHLRRTPAVLDHSRALPQSLACCAGGSGEHLGRVFPWLLVDRKTFARCEPFSFWPHNGPSLAVLSLGHFGDRPEESEQRKTRQYCADNSDCNELRPHCHEPGSQHSCLD